MNARKNVKGAIMVVTQQNSMAAMALAYRNLIINAAHTVD